VKLREVIRDRWRILAVCSERGDCQLEEVLGSFRDPIGPEAVKMMALLSWTSRHGTPRNKEKSNPIGDEIFEFKAGSLRVLYFYDADQLIICSHGFVKKTRKCPPGEKAAAAARRREYFEAQRNGELVIADE
jgi:phage-related protein